VYLRFYLHFRYRPDSDLSPEEERMVSHEGQKKVKREMDELGLDEAPSPYVMRKMNVAIQFFSDYRTFDNKFPYDGGMWDQPVEWLRPVRCIMRAQNDAEMEKRIERSKTSPSSSAGAEESEFMYIE
jgi:hypothetical protein